MSAINPNCDGEYCSHAGEVRVYPLGAGGNALLCLACFSHENRYRFVRACGSGDFAAWPLVSWMTARRYP